MYIFKSKIVSQQKIGPDFINLKIHFPEDIAKEERRQYIRVKPAPSDPIRVRFVLTDKTNFAVEAMDISVGGISFVVHEDQDHFKVGKSFSIAFTLPGFGDVNALVTITNICHHLNMVRLGMDFSLISDIGQKTVARYIAGGSYKEVQKETAAEMPLTKSNLCIVDEASRYGRYAFLDDAFNVVKSDFSKGTSSLAAHHPELIIVGSKPPISSNLLMNIRKNRLLKQVPVVLLDGKTKIEGEKLPKGVTILKEGVREGRFLKTIGNLLEQYRRTRQLQEKQIRIMSGKPLNVQIIDPFDRFSKSNILSLNKANFRLHVTQNEEQILKEAERFRPQLILMDEEMETTDPVTLSRVMEENAKLKAIPKIVLLSDKKDFDKFYSRTLFVDFLTKPVNDKELIFKAFEAVPDATKDQLLIAQRKE